MVIALTMASWLASTAWPQPSLGFATHIPSLLQIEEGKLNDIAEDWNGFIWLAREDGLYRFDGTVVKHYTQSRGKAGLPHNRVFNVLIDEERQALWLSTAKGISRFDPAREDIVHYQFDYEDPNSLADNLVVYSFMDREGKIWAGCFNHGLSLYREESDDFKNYYFKVPKADSLQQFFPSINESRINSFNFITQDIQNDDILWMGTPLGLLQFNQRTGSFKWPFQEAPVSPFNYLLKSVTWIYPLEGQLLAGTWNKAYLYDIEKQTVELIEPVTPSGEILDYVTNIYRTPDGNFNISYGNGLASYNLESRQVTGAWADQPELNRFLGIRFVDSHNRIWARSSKVSVLYDPIKQISENYLLPRFAASSPVAFKTWGNDQLVMINSIPAQYHLFNLKYRQWRSITPKLKGGKLDKDKARWNDLVKIDNGHYLFLSDSNLFELDIRTNELKPSKYEVNHPQPGYTKALVDSKGYLWLATRRIGLFRIKLDSGERQHYVDELNSDHSSSLYTWITNLWESKKGDIWIRLARSYAIYHPDTGQFKVFSHHENSDITFRYIRNFAETPSGQVWVASHDAGIGITASENLGAGLVRKITAEDGLLSNQIQQIHFGKGPLLWALGDKGFSIIDPQLQDIKNYTWGRGIPKTRLFLPLPDGKIALALEKGGVGILHTDKLHSEQSIPKPYITSIWVKDKSIYEGGNRPGIEEITINSGRDYISFEFSALGYSNPKQFAYQLEGIDLNWVEAKELRSTSYSNLPPKRYKFKLKVRQEGGEWSPVSTLEVWIPPKFWETALFKALVVLLLLLGGYRSYKWRLENVKRKERIKAEFQRKLEEFEMRALRAQMNPHFFFNSLNSIQHYIIKNKPVEAVDYLGRFSRLMRLILQNSRIKSIPLTDELEALQLYMELESLRFKIQFDHEITVSPTINPRTTEIPPMLLQPFVENAIWHGIQHKQEKGQINITIDKQQNYLTCIVQDDGIGREASMKLKKKKNTMKRHRSMGIEITKERLEMLNQSQNGVASVEIIDLYEDERPSGTKVVIRLPLED